MISLYLFNISQLLLSSVCGFNLRCTSIKRWHQRPGGVDNDKNLLSVSQHRWRLIQQNLLFYSGGRKFWLCDQVEETWLLFIFCVNPLRMTVQRERLWSSCDVSKVIQDCNKKGTSQLLARYKNKAGVLNYLSGFLSWSLTWSNAHKNMQTCTLAAFLQYLNLYCWTMPYVHGLVNSICVKNMRIK